MRAIPATARTVRQGRMNHPLDRDSVSFRLSVHRSLSKEQLFSTKPRLARSGSKTLIEKSQEPLTNPSTGQGYANHVSKEKSYRGNHPYVEVVGRGYMDEKTSTRRLSNDSTDERQQPFGNKSRAKIIRGN